MATKDEILESIANMTVLEIADLVKAMEEKFGVSAAAVAAPVAGGAAAAGRSIVGKVGHIHPLFETFFTSFSAKAARFSSVFRCSSTIASVIAPATA